MRLNKDEIAAIVIRELDGALGQDADVLATKRSMALDYYNGTKPSPPVSIDDNGNPTATRNGIVSMDVADAIHSLLAQIQPIVKTSSVEFEPVSEDDEPQAQAESDLIRLIMEREGYTTIFNSVHDALLTGNGWIKIEMEEKEEVTEAHYATTDPLEIAILLMPKDDKETKELEMEEDGTPSIYTTRTTEQICFKSIAPENILFSNQTGINDISDLRFVAEQKLFTVSQLLDLKISQSLIDNIPDEPTYTDIATNSRQSIYINGSDNLSIQEAERLKRVYICYIKIDLNGSNKSELREVWVGGRQCLMNEPCSYIPFITGSAVPMPHRIEGSGIFELLKSVQDGKTYVLRQYLDNLSVMNASRLAVVEGRVNIADLTNGRINGIVRVKDPSAIMPLPSNDIGVQAIQGLNYLDSVRTERVGSTVDFNEAQTQLMASSTVAAAGQLAKVEQMAGWFASNLVNTLIKPAFLMVHKLLREESSEPMGVKLRGKWTTMEPAKFKVRKNAIITMGMTSTERASKIMALSTVISQQANLITIGANDVLVDFKKFYNSMADWIRANNLNDPSEYLIDPTSIESLKAGKMKDDIARQKANQTKEEIVLLEQIKHQFALNIQQNELNFKYTELQAKTNQEINKVDADLIKNQDKNETDIFIQASRTMAEKADATVGASGNE
jgi:hypothetical protein